MSKSLAKVGGICSILLAVAYIVVGVSYALIPTEQLSESIEEFAPSFVANPYPFTIMCAAFAVASFLGLAYLPAAVAFVRRQAPDDDAGVGWLLWARNVAFLCFAVTALDYLWWISTLSARAHAVVGGDAATKAAVSAVGSLLVLDAVGWFRFGCLGFWCVAFGLVGLRRKALPTVLGLVYVATGVVLWVTLVGEGLHIPALVMLGAGLGGCVGAPIIHVWLGVMLLRKAR